VACALQLLLLFLFFLLGKRFETNKKENISKRPAWLASATTQPSVQIARCAAAAKPAVQPAQNPQLHPDMHVPAANALCGAPASFRCAAARTRSSCGCFPNFLTGAHELHDSVDGWLGGLFSWFIDGVVVVSLIFCVFQCSQLFDAVVRSGGQRPLQVCWAESWIYREYPKKNL